MADPNGWTVDIVFLQHKVGAGWDTLDFESAIDAESTFRMGFRLVGGTPGSPLTPGDIDFQHDKGTGDWITIATFRNLVPGKIEGAVELPPTWAETTFIPGIYPRVRVRARLTWVDGVHLSAMRTLSVFPPDPSDVAEFLADDTFAVLVTAGPGQVPGIFADPHREALQVSGRRPSLVLDTVQAEPLSYGAELTVPGKGTFVVRSKQADGEGTTRVLLEAA